MKDLIFVTGNMNKVHWVERFLGFTLAHKNVDVAEVQDLDPQVVLEQKARAAYAVLKKPVLVEDTSLVFHALGRLPGTFIKFFNKELGNEGLCRLLTGFKDRTATQTVVFGVFDGAEFIAFEHSASGTIADEPRGSFGFGFDSIFMPDGQDKTRGEMTEAEYAEFHPRKGAVMKLAEWL